MNRKRLIIASAALLALMVVGYIVFAQVAAAKTAHYTPHTHIRSANVKDVITQCPGVTTSTVHLSSAITPRNNCTPAFTADDVRAYFAKYGINLFKIQVTSGTPTISQIRFLTTADAETYTGMDLSLGGDPVVCFVEFDGNFQAFGNGDPHLQSKPFHKAFMIFDAHTGALLMIGGGSNL